MDLKKILAELREERDALDDVISDLERLDNHQRRPGHPVGLATASVSNGTSPRSTRTKAAPGEG